MSNVSSHNHNHYVDWRNARINKIEKIFGADFFRGKDILEVGAGKGVIGKYLHDQWGANVTFTEGRAELVEYIRQTNPGANVYQINHEQPWELAEKFDIIIHWGLLYHLFRWRKDLLRIKSHLREGGILFLESEVFDSDLDQEFNVNEDKQIDDQSLIGVGTRASALAIENELSKIGFTFKRYDDADLSDANHRYDWELKNTKCLHSSYGLRRFWVCYT